MLAHGVTVEQMVELVRAGLRARMGTGSVGVKRRETRELAPARILAHVGPVVSLILASLPYLVVAAACAYFLYPAIH
jgi:hypothetical protein